MDHKKYRARKKHVQFPKFFFTRRRCSSSLFTSSEADFRKCNPYVRDFVHIYEMQNEVPGADNSLTEVSVLPKNIGPAVQDESGP